MEARLRAPDGREGHGAAAQLQQPEVGRVEASAAPPQKGFRALGL